MATRRRRRRNRRYSDGPAPSGMSRDKKKKLILLGVGAVGVAAIALMSGTAGASTPTVGRPATLSAGKSWIEMPPTSGTYPKGFFLDPKTQKALAVTFAVPAGQTITSAELQARLEANIKAYQAGQSWIDVQEVGNWASVSKAERAKAAGF